jgi:oligosaccharide repeat unit polymerase
MILAVISWLIGVMIMAPALLFFIRRGNVAAIAVLLILVPQIFVRPALFFAGLDQPYPYEYFGRPDWDLIATGLSVATGWIVIFSVTHQILIRPLQPFGRLLPQINADFNIRILFLCALGTTLLGMLSTGLLVKSAGSLANFMYQVKVGKELAGSYVIREISVTGAIFSALTILYYEKRHRSGLGSGRSRRMVWIGAGLMIINFAFNYFWGNRYNIAMITVAMGVAWHFHIKRIRMGQLIRLVLVAALVLQILKLVRNAAVEEALNREIERNQSFWLDISTSLHLNQFDAFILALRDAGDRFAFREGRDFLNGLVAWIPREFYPNKETFHVGAWFRQVYEPHAVNGWPVTTMGSWYVNFGALGIVIGGVVSGIVAAWFDAGYDKVRVSFWQATVAPAMAFLMFDGGVGTGFVQDIFLVLIPIYLLALTLRILRKRKSRRLARRWALNSLPRHLGNSLSAGGSPTNRGAVGHGPGAR